MKLEIVRWYRDLATYGNGVVINNANEAVFTFKTLELPWKNNQRSISCIPEGTYEVWRMAPNPKRPYFYFWVQNVPHRTGILFHPGNYTSQIRGCILPGDKLLDVNEDGILDVTNTTRTLKKLVDLLPEKFSLTVKNGEKTG